MKTIFLTSFHPLISRNILMSGVVPLLSRDNRVVILVPIAKADYFREQFSGPHIVIEGVNTELDKHNLRFRKIILACTPTRDLFIKKRVEWYKDRKMFSYLVSVIPAILFGRIKSCIQFLRMLDYRTAPKARFRELFGRYHPNLVVSTDVQNEIDIAFLREAKELGIPTTGMVRSWDNLTSKGIIRFVPDHLVVHNEIIKAEAVHYSFIDTNIISVIGIPHYDRYKKAYDASRDHRASESTRSAFLHSLHFDMNKKLILFAPFGDRYIRDNTLDNKILETLSEFDANVLVRLPPTDTVNFNGFKTRNANVQFYESGSSTWKGGKKINEISKADEENLIQSLSFADVVVTGQSTIALDAAAFDKPIVIAAFDEEPRKYYDSVLRYFDYEYYRKFRERSGIRMAKSPQKLRELVSVSLEDSRADATVRARIREDQLYAFDGNASERLANILLTTIHGHQDNS